MDAMMSPRSLWDRFGRIDRAIAASIAVVAVAAAVRPALAADALSFAARGLFGLLPVIAASALLAGAVSAAGTDRLATRLRSGSFLFLLVAASTVGALSPLCSCTVVPIVAGLLVAGTPLPIAVAFWLSSPVMSPDTFVLIVGGIDLDFAVAQTLGAVWMGLVGGGGTAVAMRFGAFGEPLRASNLVRSSARSSDPGSWAFWRLPSGRTEFWRASGATAALLGKWLLLALLLEHLLA